MPDIIQLLPDRVANQIAAGEVIQRPASAVKELLENAVDSGADKIDLIIKDAGRTLIQVIDNGCGMTDTDARMCFERHATSKIKNADELFAIKTKGFRGEALASIAAIAQVELKTKLTDAQLGSQICIEGSNILSQEPVATANGTNFSIKNLFFNVPARRNFLKSNGIETRHIIDEFERVALAHPDIGFNFYNNGSEVFSLTSGSRRNRIVGILGKKYNERLVPLEEVTSIVKIEGYLVKPEFSKKTRGEQFFFVNNRFIKSNFLNHAVTKAFSELIAKDQFPSFFIYLQVDPATIDINIHPTKTEIKFEDEKAIYAIVNSSVRNSLGKYNITPTLDFEQETSFNVSPLEKGAPIHIPTIRVNPDFNPFKSENKSNGFSNPTSRPSNESINANFKWIDQETEQKKPEHRQEVELFESQALENETIPTSGKFFQLGLKYIVSFVPSGILLIDQKRAHERVLFEQYLNALNNGKANGQRLLFPKKIELKSSDFEVIEDLMADLTKVGFDVDIFGKNTISIQSLPPGVNENHLDEIVETLLEQHKFSSFENHIEPFEKLASTLAKSTCIKSGRKLQTEEMEHLANQLFACENPNFTHKNKPIIQKIELDELNERFDKKHARSVV